jgi:hypothetical protein
MIDFSPEKAEALRDELAGLLEQQSAASADFFHIDKNQIAAYAGRRLRIREIQAQLKEWGV